MTLNAAGLAAVAQADPAAVGDRFRRLSAQFAIGRLLDRGSRYRVDVVGKLRADAQSGQAPTKDLATYVAISVPLHCCEAWSFLGRALGCHLRGDSDAARHLAYYAELRAAMSLLASQGIGIFNSRHFAIAAGGTPVAITFSGASGTHVAAWDCLEEWTGLAGAASLMGDVLRPLGVGMQDWIRSIPGGTAWQPIASDWLRRLGLDLQLLGNDRDARNEASYRPAYLRPKRVLECRQAAEVSSQLWRLLEPSSSLSFPQLDRFLLRITMEMAFKSTHGSLPKRAPKAFGSFVDSIVQANLRPGEWDRWSRFLLRLTEPTDPIILELIRLNPARQATFDAGRAVGEARHHLAVIGRALILARLASGAARKLLVDSGTSFDELGFWWQSYGTDRGLWDSPPSAARLIDSWADADNALSDIDSWLSDHATPSYYDFIFGVPVSITCLAGAELVALWSMAS